ncbi:MAG TPA: peptide chain release factor N(5)-glutamine methyltransferase [Aestuariivirgaceae bacterium]|nr:peptide chain release factor N(5)-glutamine methyltransferase [Aestuariivirgaceae bacterium]
MIVEQRATLGDVLARLRRRLEAAGIANPALDARLIVMKATGLTHEALIAAPDHPISEDQIRRLDDMADRRLAGEPVSRIFAEREFYDRVFTIGPASLDPRPDTETLVERALAFARTHSFQRSPAGPAILDLGTGSGAILVTLLAELPDARGTGTDLSPAALDEARANAARHGVAERARFVPADWCSGLEGLFDLIVSNPPYIPSDDLHRLEREVRDWDPLSALDGGPDGLEAYRDIAAGTRPLLAPGGRLMVEIGAGQEPAVAAIFARCGWEPAPAGAASRDLAGHVRVLAFALPHPLPSR